MNTGWMLTRNCEGVGAYVEGEGGGRIVGEGSENLELEQGALPTTGTVWECWT